MLADDFQIHRQCRTGMPYSAVYFLMLLVLLIVNLHLVLLTWLAECVHVPLHMACIHANVAV
jgi:hypothetical protein